MRAQWRVDRERVLRRRVRRLAGKERKFCSLSAVRCALLLLLLAACGKDAVRREAAEDTARRTADGARGKYERVISTAPSNTEIIAALGLADRLVAVDRYSADIAGLPSGAALIDFLNPDAEILLTLKPDVIITNSINHQRNGSEPLEALSKLGIEVVFIPVSNSLEGIMNDVMTIAGLFGVPERGEEITGTMRNEIAVIKKTGMNISEKRAVYFEIEPPPHIVSFGSGVFLDEMLTIIGAENIFADQRGFFVVNAEELIARNPDVILTNVSELSNPVTELYARGGFANISACKNKRVYFIGTNESARPSPNVMNALKQIAHAVYPEYYPAERSTDTVHE